MDAVAPGTLGIVKLNRQPQLWIRFVAIGLQWKRKVLHQRLVWWLNETQQ